MSKTRLCCVPGNVRYCILFLTIASTSVLFANLILFSVAVLYQEEQPNCETDRFRFFGKTVNYSISHEINFSNFRYT